MHDRPWAGAEFASESGGLSGSARRKEENRCAVKKASQGRAKPCRRSGATATAIITRSAPWCLVCRNGCRAGAEPAAIGRAGKPSRRARYRYMTASDSPCTMTCRTLERSCGDGGCKRVDAPPFFDVRGGACQTGEKGQTCDQGRGGRVDLLFRRAGAVLTTRRGAR